MEDEDKMEERVDEGEELHPLVQLLLKRMASHPEEFERGVEDYRTLVPKYQRWHNAIETVDVYGTEADKAAFSAALGKIYMDEAYRWTMDELCNGEERRRQEEARQAQAKNLQQGVLQQSTATQQLTMQRLQNYQNAYANSITNISSEEWTESMRKALGLK